MSHYKIPQLSSRLFCAVRMQKDYTYCSFLHKNKTCRNIFSVPNFYFLSWWQRRMVSYSISGANKSLIIHIFCYRVLNQIFVQIQNSQYPEINSNKVLNTIYKTYIGLTSMLQGFQKCIA